MLGRAHSFVFTRLVCATAPASYARTRSAIIGLSVHVRTAIVLIRMSIMLSLQHFITYHPELLIVIQLFSWPIFIPGPKKVGSSTHPLFPPFPAPSSPFPSSFLLLFPPFLFLSPSLLPFPPFHFPCCEAAPSNRLEGLGSGLAPSAGPGGAPAASALWVNLKPKKRVYVAANHVLFLLNKMWKFKYKWMIFAKWLWPLFTICLHFVTRFNPCHFATRQGIRCL